MFGSFPQSELQIIGPDGTNRGIVKGIVSSNQITVPDKQAVILTGDEMRRKLPNGIEEVFEVIDPVFYDGMHGIPACYQVKIRRKGSFPAGTGGNFTFNVSGPNARVNIGSHDQSQNIAADQSVFGDLKTTVKAKIPSEDQSHLLSLIEKMETNSNSRRTFLTAYQDFIAAAANHMTIIAPFLPALSKFLG